MAVSYTKRLLSLCVVAAILMSAAGNVLAMPWEWEKVNWADKAANVAVGLVVYEATAAVRGAPTISGTAVKVVSHVVKTAADGLWAHGLGLSGMFVR